MKEKLESQGNPGEGRLQLSEGSRTERVFRKHGDLGNNSILTISVRIPHLYNLPYLPWYSHLAPELGNVNWGSWHPLNLKGTRTSLQQIMESR